MNTVTATAASGAVLAIMPTSGSSSDPANADSDSAGATHHGRPSWITSKPSAIPNGKMPSPAENESVTPATIWVRRPSGATLDSPEHANTHRRVAAVSTTSALPVAYMLIVRAGTKT